VSTGLFSNGNARIARLAIWKVALGCFAIALIQIQGFLPGLDFLSPKWLKIASFSLAVILSLIKSGEMFFDKTVSMFKNNSFDTTFVQNPVTTSTTQLPNT